MALINVTVNQNNFGREIKKVLKSLEKRCMEDQEKILRKSSIKAANYLKEAVATSAEKISPLGAELIRSLKMEKRSNWGSGHNAGLNGGDSIEYRMTLNPAKNGMTNVIGRNAAWAIIVSNLGRRAIDAIPGSFLALATKEYKYASKKRNGQPIYYRGSGGTWYVSFQKHVRAVQGSHWIDKTVQDAVPAIKEIIRNTKP